MEQLNKVTLRGMVGSTRCTDIQGKTMLRMTLATNEVCKDKFGGVIIETTWHNVVVWQKEDMPKLADISKGSKVYIEGRLRNIRYTNSNGDEVCTYEILANKVEIL